MDYEVDRKTLQKVSNEFRNVASRLLSSDMRDSSKNLERLMAFIDTNPLVSSFIQKYASLPEVETYELKQGQRSGWNIPVEKSLEIGCTYWLLKYAADEKRDYQQLSFGYSTSTNFQDNADAFNKSVVNPFINYIVEYLQNLMIDAGMNEASTTTVHISEGSNYFAGDIHQSMLAMGQFNNFRFNH